MDCQFHFPEHRMLENRLNKSGFAIHTVGDKEISVNVVDGPFGSQLKVEEYQEHGVPLIRVSNCRTGEILVNEELVYISEEKHKQLIRSEVLPGDVLVTKAGHILGYTAVFPRSLARGNITSHLASIRPSKGVIPGFLATYLASSLGIRQIYRWGNKATRPELNTDEVRALLVPLPPENVQLTLMSEMETARKEQKKKLAEADALLTGMEEFLLQEIGLAHPSQVRQSAFAIRVHQLQGPLNPERYKAFGLEKSIKGTTMGCVAEILEEKLSPSRKGPNKEWDWIRIDDLENEPLCVGAVRTELGHDIQGALFVVKESDILLARLGPTILNRKFVLCPKTQRQTVASSEFLVLRCRENWKPLVVLWLLRTSLYRDLIYSKGRGATPSRYRVNREDLASLPFPNINPSKQESLAAEIERRVDKVRQLREEAAREWETAKARFEAKLLDEDAKSDEPTDLPHG